MTLLSPSSGLPALFPPELLKTHPKPFFVYSDNTNLHNFLSLNSTDEDKAKFIHDQAEAITKALHEYHPGVPTVFNLDIGHTDPQSILPNGGWMKIDGIQQTISVRY